jgi:hypothetical protein
MDKEQGSLTAKEQASLTVHLTEYSRLAGELHTTFQRQQQQLNTMVVLASAITVGIIAGLKSDEFWNWIQVANGLKFGSGVGLYYAALSLSRYAFPLLSITGWLLGFWYYGGFEDFSGRQLRVWCVAGDAAITLLVFGVGYWVVNRSGQFTDGKRKAWITRDCNLKP